MKNLILIFTLISLAFGCAENSTEPDQPESEERLKILKTLAELGVSPTATYDITYIGLNRDSIDYKLVGGKKNDHGWIAKFKPSGEEIFSFELNDLSITKKPYSHCNNSSIELIHNELLFIVFYITDTPDPNESIGPTQYTSIMVVLDFSTGKELCRYSSLYDGVDGFRIRNEPYFYFIEESNYSISKVIGFHVVSKDGGYLWGRETKQNEEGLKSYRDCFFLDDERIVFSTETHDEIIKHYYKVINLKEYKVIFDKLKDDIPFTGDFAEESDVVYREDTIFLFNDNIRINYAEFREKKIIDDAIQNTYHFEYDLLAKYYYDLDAVTGKELSKGKLE